MTHVRWSIPVSAVEVPIAADGDTSDRAVILAHGAGSHMDQKTVLWLSGLLQSAGLGVIRFNFLYRVLGKGIPDRMPVLTDTYQAVIDSVRSQLGPKRLIVGGHSMGGRAASMLEAAKPQANGLLLFAYPLHPAGQPEKLRDAHLSRITIPTLQVNGTLDPLCEQPIMERVASSLDPRIWTLKWLDGADHSYGVKKSSGRTKKDVEAEIVATVKAWTANLL